MHILQLTSYAPIQNIKVLKIKKETPELCPPYENTVRRWPSASQDESPHQELNLPAP